MARIILLACLAALAGCSKASSSFPDVRFPTLSSQSGPSLATCSVKKCLTVYLAPWCGYCRKATPLILEARKFLKKQGVETRVIIGMDQPQTLQEYALEFGPDTLLDLNGALNVSGVPHFYVSNASGEIIKEIGGLPYGAQSAESLATAFGLP